MARPKGQPKLGGRGKGTPNKVTAEKRRKTAELIAQAEADGTLPLQFLLDIMHGRRKATQLQIQAATSALPFCHPRLATVDVNTTTRYKDARQLTDDELMALIIEGGGHPDYPLPGGPPLPRKPEIKH